MCGGQISNLISLYFNSFYSLLKPQLVLFVFEHWFISLPAKKGALTLWVGYVTQLCHMKTRVGTVCLNHRRAVIILIAGRWLCETVLSLGIEYAEVVYQS